MNFNSAIQMQIMPMMGQSANPQFIHYSNPVSGPQIKQSRQIYSRAQSSVLDQNLDFEEIIRTEKARQSMRQTADTDNALKQSVGYQQMYG